MALSGGVAFVDVLPRTTAFTAKLAADMNKSLATVEGGIGARAAAIGKKLILPFTIAGAAATKIALDFDQSFTRIAAVSNTAASEIEGMKSQVLDLAGATAQSPRELADALYFLASAGLRSDQVMSTLEASARASAVGLGETADVARLTANVLNAYGDITAEQAIDTLVAAVREGTADTDEFADALGRILPISSRAGVGFDEVTASLAALSNIGLDVNEGVTAMRGLLQALVAPGTIAAQTLADIGISTEQMREVISEEGILGALQLLEERTGGNIDVMRDIIPNIRSLTGELGLTGENAEQVAGVFERVADSTGSLDRAFETTAESPTFKLQQAMAELETAAIELGAALSEIVVPALQAVAAFATAITNPVETLIAGFTDAEAESVRMGAVLAVLEKQFGLTGDEVQRFVESLSPQAVIQLLKAIDDGTFSINAFRAAIEDSEAGREAFLDFLDVAAGKAAELAPDLARVVEILFGWREPTEALARSAFDAGAGLDHLGAEAAELEEARLDEFFGGLRDDVEGLRPLFDAAGLDFEQFQDDLMGAALGSKEGFQAFRDSLTKDVFPEIKSALADFRDSMVDSLNFVDDVFSEFSDKRHVDAQDILREIEQQARAQERFAEDINAILERGGPAADAVAQSLIAMGEEGVTAADAIAGANKETFQGIVSGFAQGESAAREAAGTIQEQMVGTLEDIRDILEAIARKAWGVRVNLEGNAQTQLDNLQAQLQRLATRGYTIAVRPEVKVGAALGAIIPAQAGLITRPTVLAGEGGRDEAIIPLESGQGHRVLVGAFTDALREVQGGRKIVISGPVQIRMTDWGRGIGQMRGLVVEEMDERRDHRDRVRRMR